MQYFLNESAECERCERVDALKERDSMMVCYDCQEELDRAAWDAKHDAPLTCDKALLYADAHAPCLIAAYEHGETEEGMLALLRNHLAECQRCNPVEARCERKAA